MTRVPKQLRVATEGVNHVRQVVDEKLGWIFRSEDSPDLGIDGTIDVLQADASRTLHQRIGVQIKSGLSFFKNSRQNRFECRLKREYLERFSEANPPVILIVYHPHEKVAYWCDIAARLRERPASGKTICLEFARDQTRFDASACEALRKLATRHLRLQPALPLTGVLRLPLPPRCIGRRAEIEELVTGLLATPRELISVLGGPGIGKSCIVEEALHDPRIVERFGSRRWFVRCDGVQGGGELLSAIASEMDMPAGADPTRWMLEELARADTLLVLDNFETPWQANEKTTCQALTSLARALPLRIVATVRGFRRPCDLPWRSPVEVRALSAADARELFLKVAGHHLAQDPLLDEFLQKFDGVPLAVKLLAKLTEGTSSLQPLYEEWNERRTELLRTETGDTRYDNLAASFELSICSHHVSPAARQLLSVLSWLPDGMEISQARAWLQAPARETVMQLENTALAFEEGGRLRVLAPIREHVIRRHPPTPEDRDRLYRHFFTLALTHGPTVGKLGGADAAAALNREAGNLDALIKRGLASKEPALAIEAAEAAIALKSWLRYSGLGTLELLSQAEQIAQQLENPRAQAKAIQAQAEVALARSQYNEAEAAYGRSLKLHRDLADRPGEVDALLGLGHIERYRSESRQSQKRYEEALALASELGHRELIAHAKKSLGHAALALKQVAMAQRHYEEALGEFTALGDTCEMANCHRSLGLALIDGQALDEGRQLLHTAQGTFEQVGDLRGAADCHRALGCLAIRRRQLDDAEGCYRQALEHYRRVKDRRGEALCLFNLGRLRKGTSKSEARQDLCDALELFKGSASHMSIGRAHELLARLAPNDDDRRRHKEKAKEAWSRIGRDDLIARFLGGAPV